MRLAADPAQRHALGKQLFDQPHVAGQLLRLALQVVVVGEQHRLRIGGPGRLEGDAEGESRDVSVTWSKEDLEQLLAETTGPAITLAFDQDELQSILAEPEVDAHGFREKALILTVAAAAAAGSGASVADAAHNDAGPGTAITPSYLAVHDEAGLTARGIAATPLVASH